MFIVRFRVLSYRRHLPPLHPFPADEPIQIIDQEHHETDNHGNIADILHCRQSPQDDQHHIVGGVGQGKTGAAAEGQVHGGEAGGHGQGAGEDVSVVKFEYVKLYDHDNPATGKS